MWRMAQRGQRIVVKLSMGAKTLPDADSFNTVVEIKGWQHPEQVEPTISSQTPTSLTRLSVYLLHLSFQSLKWQGKPICVGHPNEPNGKQMS